MKNLKPHPWMILALATGLLQAHGQQPFQNLDFESPILPFDPEPQRHYVEASKAIPYWIPYSYGKVDNLIVYNDVGLGSAMNSFHDNKSNNKPIAGDYSVLLQADMGDPQGSSAIGQIGTIPANARSLQFYGSEGFEVTFGGSLIPIFVLREGTVPYQVMVGDISMFAGQTGELRFTLPHRDTFPPYSMCWFDNIQFSTEAVPEPSTLALLGLGGFALIWKCKRSRT